MKIKVYDFDNTIYEGDSSVDFYFYCLKRNPKVWLYLPSLLFYAVMFGLKIYNKTKFKQGFYKYLKAVKNIDKVLLDFWNSHFKNIKDWYLTKDHKDDVVISASPEFLLEIPCKKLGVKKLIASKVDKATGVYDGLNCSETQKLKRLKQEYDNFEITEFYSDSLNDSPLAQISENSFFVKGNKLEKWTKFKRFD